MLISLHIATGTTELADTLILPVERLQTISSTRLTDTNTTTRDLGLDPETVIPAGGSLEISEKDGAKFEGSPVVAAWFENGDLVAGKPKTKKRKGLETQAFSDGVDFTDDDLAAAVKKAKAG